MINVGDDANVSVGTPFGKASAVLDVQVSSKYTGSTLHFRILATTLERVLGAIRSQAAEVLATPGDDKEPPQ